MANIVPTTNYCPVHNNTYPIEEYCHDCAAQEPTKMPSNKSPTPFPLTTIQTDADIAAAFRAELSAALEPLLEVCTRAKRAGFIPNFSVAFDPTDKYHIALLQLTKIY